MEDTTFYGSFETTFKDKGNKIGGREMREKWIFRKERKSLKNGVFLGKGKIGVFWKY